MASFRGELAEFVSHSLATVEEGRRPKSPKRTGWGVGIPVGGSTAVNPGSNLTAGSMDRGTFMQQLLQAYLACPWSSACIDVIARTCTAGGLEVVYETTPYGSPAIPEAPPEVREIQELLKFVNPENDIRQLMRTVITDLMIFGDSFTEVVWVAGKPAALYPLDPTTITILSDEHGNVSGFQQQTQTNRKAYFSPKQIIHVKFDSPGDTLYGVSPTQKSILPITSWLFAAALVKETMKKGDPLRAHIDWPIALPESERSRFSQQYMIRNMGARNIGNLFETKGGAVVRELGINQISNWEGVLQRRRDEICSGYGVPPSKVGIIEAGNLGGGTGTQQDKSFRVNTCGPIQEIVLEKFSFALLYQTYGITDWYLKFGAVDWRDDEVIENIRDQRIRNGVWVLNKARADVGEPPVEGGDDPVLVDRQNMVLWKHLSDLSEANLEIAQVAGQPKNAPVQGNTNPDAGAKGGQATGAPDAPPVPGTTK